MTKKISTESLYTWARETGVMIIFAKLSIDLLGKADTASKKIYLNSSLMDRPRQFRCVLAEELGHIMFPPRPGHIRFHSRGFMQIEDCSMVRHTVAQDERKALDWATGVLMPDVEFNRIMENGGHSISEIAELFEVEPWFMMHKIAFYRRKARGNGQRIKWRDLIRRA